MKRKKLIFGMITIFILLIIIFIIWKKQQLPKESMAIKLGYIPFTSDLPFFVALENGYFKEEGIEITPIKFNSSSECLNAMLAGHTVGSMGNSYSALFAIAMKAPNEIKIFHPIWETDNNYVSHLLIQKDSHISSVNELRGKKIGTYAGATQLLFLKLFLNTNYIDPDKDVTIVQVSSGLQLQALEANQFEALFTIEPYATIALAKGIAKDLMPFCRKLILNPFPAGASSFSASFLKRNPRDAKKIYRALGKAIDFIFINPNDAKLYLPKYTPLDEEIALKSNVYTWAKEDRIEFEIIQREVDLFIEYGILAGRLNVKDIFLDLDKL